MRGVTDVSRLEWNVPGERFYEVGVDQGVLYVGDGPGVPWNGLISIKENPTGGEEKPYYLDGVKRLSRSTPEEYSAVIEAFTYPDEFAGCDGSKQIDNGLWATQQVRQPFHLCYRTRVGNDTRGTYAYKLHILYNARVSPTDRNHQTISEQVDPENFSWAVSASTTYMEGVRPTPHYIVDSRNTPKQLLENLEDVLYGTPSSAPRMLSVEELRFLFTSYNLSIFDAGDPDDPKFRVFDGGQPPTTVQSDSINGGVP